MVELARLAVKHNLWLVSDEAYRELHYVGDSAISIWGITEDDAPGITGRTPEKTPGVAVADCLRDVGRQLCKPAFVGTPETADLLPAGIIPVPAVELLDRPHWIRTQHQPVRIVNNQRPPRRFEFSLFLIEDQ